MTAPFHHELDFLRNAADLVAHAFQPQSPALVGKAWNETVWQFFFIGPTLGLVGIGIVVLAARSAHSLVTSLRLGWQRRFGIATGTSTGATSLPRLQSGAGPDIDQLLLIALAVTFIIWSLIMFGPGSTVIHQGSHGLVVLAFALGVLGWWSLSPRLAAGVVGVTAAFTLYLYLRFTPFATGPGTPYKSEMSTSIAALVVLAAVACLACLWWIGKQPQADPSDDGAGPRAPGADTPQALIPSQVPAAPQPAVVES